MALYVSLSQLAVMTALSPDGSASSEVALTVLGTSLGLVLAHQIAFRMSSRLVAEGSRLESHAPALLRAQVVGGAVVTGLAVVPIVVFGAGAYRLSMALLLAFVMVVGYLVARSAPVSRARALLYVAFVAVVVVVVLAVKSLVAH
jgi:hypothetical protein